MTDGAHSSSTDPALRAARVDESAAGDEIDLRQLWGILRTSKWIIVACVVAAGVLGVAYLFVTQPTYRASALLQIKSDQTLSPLAGISNQLNTLTGTGSASIAASEMQIIKSRSVLGQAVENLGLDIAVKPRYLPIVGRAIAKRNTASPTASSQAAAADGDSWFWHYAWAPAEARVTQFDVPRALFGKPFNLRALGNGRYVLYGPEGARVLRGRIGQLAQGRTPGGRKIRLYVQSLTAANPPTDFKLVRNARLAAVSSLSHRLGVSEQGQESGIVQVTLEGKKPEHIQKIVNSVVDNYLRQDVEAKSKRAKKSLVFLNQQLPQLKADVSKAETRLADYQQSHQQSVNLDQEGQSLLRREVDLQKQKSQLNMKLAELRQTYTGKHPALQAAHRQMGQLDQQSKRLHSKIDQLPDAQKAILRLKRNLRVKTQLYTALLNRAQKLRVAKAGTVGDVRIVDHAATPISPVAPKAKLILMLSLVLGGMIGVGAVLLRAALRHTVNDPNDIEHKLGVPVYAVVPFSKWQARHTKRLGKGRHKAPILARDQNQDSSVEALRSLRTSLFFARMGNNENIILMTGVSPGVGKSFVSVNLAYLQSEAGQSVVIIDADMRRGMLHLYAGDNGRGLGLSQVLARQATIDDALHELNGVDNVKVMTTGQIPPNPSELLMKAEFGQMLAALRQRFDLVIIDAPPVLAVTDASVIAASAPDTVTFMIVRAGVHAMREIEESLKRFARQDCKVSGVVFNGYQQAHAEYGGYYNYYNYEYRSMS